MLVPLAIKADLLPLGALVDTNLGEGFVVGRSLGGDPSYSVMLFNGELRHSRCDPFVTTVTLIDPKPIEHPNTTPGLREYLLRR